MMHRTYHKRTVRRVLAAAAAGGVLAWTGLAWAAPSRADNLSYLSRLTNGGLVIDDAAAAVNYGWAMCSALDVLPAETVARTVFTNTSWAAVPNMAVARFMVTSAVIELCPWNRGQVI